MERSEGSSLRDAVRGWDVRALLAIQVGFVLAFAVVSDPRLAQLVGAMGGLVNAVFALTWALRARRERAILICLAVALAFIVMGDGLSWWLSPPDGAVPFPSIADIPYVIGSILVAGGMIAAARSVRRVTSGAVFDTALASGGMAVIAVQFGVVPAFTSGGPLLDTLVLVIYTGVDIVGVVVTAWLLLSGRRVAAGAALLAIANGAWYAADMTYAVQVVTGSYVSGGWVDLGWYLPNILLALTCRTGLGATTVRIDRGPMSQRLLFAGVIGLLAPIGLLLSEPLGLHTSRLAVAVATIVPVAAALARMLGLVKALEDQARHDPLTGLLNRQAFTERAEEALAHGELAAVLVIDLDGFKAVNDSYGHAAGDQVLIDVAARLRAGLPADSTIARFGGDEFCALVRAGHGLCDLTALRDALSRPLEHQGVMLAGLGASIGMARVEPACTGSPVRVLASQPADPGTAGKAKSGSVRQVVEAVVAVADASMYADKSARCQ